MGLCPLGDKLFAVGGYDGQQYLNDVECYDPITNEWVKVGSGAEHSFVTTMLYKLSCDQVSSVQGNPKQR